VDALPWDVVGGVSVAVAVPVVEVNLVEEDFEVTPAVEVDDVPEVTPALAVDVPKDIPVVEGNDKLENTPVVVELLTGGVVMGSPPASVVLATQYHSLGIRLEQLMPVFQADRLAAGTPIMEFRSSQVLFYAQCQLIVPSCARERTRSALTSGTGNRMAHGVAAPEKVVCSAESDVRFHVAVGDGSSV
jgi:hypothetical protein